ncbi:Tetratricopeptide-like helical [Penicillium herquei]|nr:Tetratricopeptide-like helical [Penicillium herquei]
MAFQHHNYTVAWICALPLEMTAAKMMLDEVHPRLSQSNSDHNTYTLGSISGHNVVVACLPSGVYGTTTAAVVVAHMLETFPCLRFGLMVGIGGGVPSKDIDIRLGDVVVSMPTATSGGVIQYDYGKTIRDGGFERTGSLNKPPQYLLTAVSQMRSNTMGENKSIDEIASEALQGHPNLQEQFSRPDKDWLFQAKYDHPSKNAECSECDQSQLVARQKRESNMTTIHYGLIASGNQVMKNAKTRDAIAQELGILCFEMEAAGLMDQLPCLVIRGVCDYCDSHKHKQWQEYAALIAAAYTKALVGMVTPYSPGHTSHTSHLNQIHHWMIPFARNSRFVGRQQEIDRLEHLISHTSGGTKIAIHGLGGIGKTQIALELAYRIREKGSGCSVFWVPCVSYGSMEQAYMSIASALGISNTEPTKVKEKVKAHLSQESVAKWLLIFDNADDTEMWIEGSSTTPPLKNILPRTGNGHILFTSRNRKLAVKLAAPNVLSVPDVDQTTALNILKKSVIRKDLLREINMNTADALLEQLGFLPLAISQAAAYINENDISLSDYLSLLKEEESSATELLSEEFEDDARYTEIQNPVITTWLISFQQIQQLDELAADYLSFIACINPRDIPQAILPPAPSAKKRVDALGVLKAYSFVSEHESHNLISLHRLVHLAMRNWMRKTKVIDHWIHQAALQLCELSINDDRGLRRDCLPHALYLTNGEEFQHVYLKYIEFMWEVGLSLSHFGRYNEASSIFTKNLEVVEEALGPEHPDTLTGLRRLAFLFKVQDKYNESEAIYLRVLEGFKKTLGSEHIETLKSLRDLGSILERQHKYGEAENMYRRAFEGFDKAVGSEHPETLYSLEGLGSVFEEEGKYKEAEVMYRRALEGFQKSLGSEHFHTLSALRNIGILLMHQYRYKEAEAMYRQELEGREKAFGSEHHSTFSAMENLGTVLARQDKYEEANAMYEQALEGTEKAFGLEHPYSLSLVQSIASLLQQQNRYQEAETLYRQALEGYERVLGPESLDTIYVIIDLASVLEHRERYEEAKAMYERALESAEKGFGPEHPDSLSLVQSIASLLQRQNRYQEAETLHRQALKGYERVLGPESPEALFIIESLEFVLEQQGKHEQATAMYERALEVREKTRGSEHPATLVSVRKLETS